MKKTYVIDTWAKKYKLFLTYPDLTCDISFNENEIPKKGKILEITSSGKYIIEIEE